MTDPIIHQLYCTHCTYGTSALHRHTGNIKDQPFEYSTRAGSVEKAASHETFQRFEKMYFRGLPLPSDTPADARQRLTAQSSPWRRLIAAKTAGANLVAHVAYRTSDTSTPPRTGSYFAHLLLHDAIEPTQQSWSLSDALQMWGATEFWKVEDRGDIPHDLDTVSQLSDLPGFGSVINDAKLLCFLTTPANGDFRDEPSPKCAIPQRWREKPVEKRLALFTALFHSVATLNLDRRERLLVAVEPSLAALLFYGVLRLLPRQGLVDQLSVSTFEPHADPFSTVLTATDFYDPSRSEQYLAGLRGGVTIFNTYSQTLRQEPPESRYVTTMLGNFLGPTGRVLVDGKRDELAAAGKSGLSNIRDCEQYFGASELAERLLRTGPSPVSERDISALSLDVARQKFRLTLLTRLRSLSNNEQTWTELAQSPSRVTLMAHVLSEEPALPNSAGTLEQLCDCLPANELPRFFEDRLISSDLRLARLQREVVETGQLPAGCESLWTPANHGAGVDRPLLEKLFAALDDGKLRALCRTVFESAAIKREMTGPQSLIMLTYLARAAKDNPRKRADLTSLLEDERLEEDHWDVLLRDPALRSILFDVYPNDEPILHVKLTDMLNGLADSGRKFPLRLDILKAAESRLPDDRRQELSRWYRVRASLDELKQLQAEPAGLIDRFVTGARKNRMRELGASVANECQKILEASDGPQDVDKHLKPLLRANCASGEIPAAFRAGMMQTLRGPDAPRVARKSQKQESPTLVATAIAWLPIACATLLVAVIATGIYLNQVAIRQLLVGSPETNKSKPSESPPTGLKLTPSKPPETTPLDLMPLEPKPPEPKPPEPKPPDPKPPDPKPKAPTWTPKELYFARHHNLTAGEQGEPRWTLNKGKVVDFVSLHGPYLHVKHGPHPLEAGPKTWVLVAKWTNDKSLTLFAPAPTAETGTPSSDLIAMWEFTATGDEVVAKRPPNSEVSRMRLTKVTSRIQESWNACVLGIHPTTGTPEFHSFNTAAITRGPLKVDKQGRFNFPDEAAFQSTDERLWAISGDGSIKLQNQLFAVGDKQPKSLFSGSWTLPEWPKTLSSPTARFTFGNGFAEIAPAIERELVERKSETDSDYSLKATDGNARYRDCSAAATAVQKTVSGLNSLLKDTKALRDTIRPAIVMSDGDAISKMNHTHRTLKQSRLMFEYLGIEVVKVPEDAFPSRLETDFKKKGQEWIEACNEFLRNVKSAIKGNSDLIDSEIESLRTISLGLSGMSLSGSVYRIVDGEIRGDEKDPGKGHDGDPSKYHAVIRGIAVKIGEFKHEPSAEEKK